MPMRFARSLKTEMIATVICTATDSHLIISLQIDLSDFMDNLSNPEGSGEAGVFPQDEAEEYGSSSEYFLCRTSI